MNKFVSAIPCDVAADEFAVHLYEQFSKSCSSLPPVPLSISSCQPIRVGGIGRTRGAVVEYIEDGFVHTHYNMCVRNLLCQESFFR